MSDLDGFDALIAGSNPSMVVVSAAAGDEVDACLVGFHSQCSIEPVRYAVWLSKANHTHRLAVQAEVLGVHWLRPSQRDLASSVGSVSLDRRADKMAAIPWHRGPGGAVLIDDVAGSFVGRVVHTHDDGDHVCFVLEPCSATGDGEDVLRFDAVRDLDPGHDADPSKPPREPG
jgi:flavin reductase (DIM6/NTAB) family NADH-FMN oxidoreductase RutF